MSVAISSWYKLISPQLPGCPNPVIKDYLIDVLRDFCEETKLWDENQLTPISLVADTPEYALSSSSGDIVGVDSAEIDEVPIYPASTHLLNESFTNWRHKTQRRPQNYFVSSKADTIRLIYTPSEALADGLVVWCQLKPLETATQVEDFLWDRYGKSIADGAAGLLMQVVGKPWTNPQYGMEKERSYKMARDTAKNDKVTGRAPAQLVLQSEFFC